MDQYNNFFAASPASFLESNVVTVLGPSELKYSEKNSTIGMHRMDLSKSKTLKSGSGMTVIDVGFYTAPSPIGLSSKDFGNIVADAKLNALWLPWSPDTVVEADIPPEASYFFTAGFSGCSFTVSGDIRRPHVVHSNMVDSLYMPLPNVVQGEDGKKMLISRDRAKLGGYELNDIYGLDDEKNLDKKLGNALALSRQKAGISQPTMANMLGITIEALGAYENGLGHYKYLDMMYCRALNLNYKNLRQKEENFPRTMTRTEKYNRVYMGQELKSKVRAMKSGGTYNNDILGVMSWADYGGGQDEKTGKSGQGSVVGFKDTGTGHWRFVSQYQTVDIRGGSVTLNDVKCVVCKHKPTACTCP